MKGFFLFCVLTMLLCNGKADDLILKSGKIYKNFKVHNVNTSGPVIMYENGMATIPFADLPDDLRAKYAEQEKQFSVRSQTQLQEQHKQPEAATAETANSGNSVSKSGENAKSAGDHREAKTIHTGPRGGGHHIDSRGDLVLKSGKVYKQFKVQKVDAAGLVIMYENGLATIPFSDLPDDLRAKYAEQEKQFSARPKAQSREQQKQPETPTGKTASSGNSGNSGNSVSKSGGYVKSSGNYGGTKTIYTGPRGGRYYINSHGNKTYIRRKK